MGMLRRWSRIVLRLMVRRGSLVRIFSCLRIMGSVLLVMSMFLWRVGLRVFLRLRLLGLWLLRRVMSWSFGLRLLVCRVGMVLGIGYMARCR